MRLKNLKFIILIAICVLSIASMSSCGKAKTKKLLDFYPKPDGTYAVAIGDAKYLDEIVIPKKHKGKSVTEIAQSGFASAPNLESVVIPDSITKIGASAFYNCSSLTSVVIPDSVTSLDVQAFAYCDALTSIVIPDSVTSIGRRAFSGCQNLFSVTIGGGLTEINDDTFESCNKIVEVINKSSIDTKAIKLAEAALEVHGGQSKLSNIDDYFFYSYNGVNYLLGYAGDKTELTLPENYNGAVYEIYKYAFYQSEITGITTGTGVTAIGEYAFESCSKLTSASIGTSVASIGNRAFYHCSELTGIAIPGNVKTIGSSAFYSCEKLTSVALYEGITSIGGSAFSACKNLSSITIPSSVSEIGAYAFSNCTNLTSAKFITSSGWSCSVSTSSSGGTAISASELAKPETAAKYLTEEHYHRIWTRK